MRFRVYGINLSCVYLCAVVAVCVILSPNMRAERLPLKVYTSADALARVKHDLPKLC
jgi:hypothetical protein